MHYYKFDCGVFAWIVMFNHNKEWLTLPCSTRQLNFYSSSSIAILQLCTHKWIYGVYKFYTSIVFLTKTTTGSFLGHASNFVITLMHQFPSIFNICLWCCTHKDTGWLHFTWLTQCSTKNMWRLISMMNKQTKKCLYLCGCILHIWRYHFRRTHLMITLLSSFRNSL